jgi:sugar phosphate isomerase/epimerase
VEIVGPEMDRGFPDLSAEFEHRFKNAIDKYGLIPICYGGYVDPQRPTGRRHTLEEQVEYLKTQIRAASRLGFPVIRLNPCQAVYTELPAYAEKWKVKIGMEIHAPLMIETMDRQIAAAEKADSPYLGFVPDCGAFCLAPADIYLERFTNQGVPKEILDCIVKMWKEKATEPEMQAEVKRLGGGESAVLAATESQMYFGHSDPAALKRIMKRIVHVHGKFFNMENGEESAVRLPEIVTTLQEGGYSGWMACEYEGHHWFSDKDSLNQIKKHQAAVRKIFAENA